MANKRLPPAIRFRGLWYSAPCCHACAMQLAIDSSEDVFSVADLDRSVEAGDDYKIGYETKGGEFTVEED